MCLSVVCSAVVIFFLTCLFFSLPHALQRRFPPPRWLARALKRVLRTVVIRSKAPATSFRRFASANHPVTYTMIAVTTSTKSAFPVRCKTYTNLCILIYKLLQCVVSRFLGLSTIGFHVECEGFCYRQLVSCDN